MANLIFLSISLSFLALPLLGTALSGCFGPCKTLNDCSGKLICINGKCNDDPDVGTTICKGGSTPSPTTANTCERSGNPTCQGKTHRTNCSPQVTAATPALLTLNDFSEGGDGGWPSECDEKYHSNTEHVVALSTGWYNCGSRCGKTIRITANNGRSVSAKVVDECDSMNGCDKEHAGQPPCRNYIVDGSAAVWNAMGLNQNDGEVEVTWSMA